MRFANGLAGPWMPGQEIGPRGSAPCQRRSAVFFLDFGRYRHRAQCCTASPRCVSNRESYPTSAPRIHLHADLSQIRARASLPDARASPRALGRGRRRRIFFRCRGRIPARRLRAPATGSRRATASATRVDRATPHPRPPSALPNPRRRPARLVNLALPSVSRGRAASGHYTQPSSARCVGPTLDSRKGTARVASSPTESSGRDDGQTRRRGRG